MGDVRNGKDTAMTLPAWPEGCPPVLWDDGIPDADYRVMADMLIYGWYRQPWSDNGPGVWTAALTRIYCVVVTSASHGRDALFSPSAFGWTPFIDRDKPSVISSQEDYLSFQALHYRFAIFTCIHPNLRRFAATQRSKEWRALPWPVLALAMQAE